MTTEPRPRPVGTRRVVKPPATKAGFVRRHRFAIKTRKASPSRRRRISVRRRR